MKHKHKAIFHEDRPFNGQVGSWPNPAAHGNICRWFFCSCGCVRRVNINQNNTEEGHWEKPILVETPKCAP